MLKKALTAFVFPFLLLLSLSEAESANPVAKKSPNQSELCGIRQKMSVGSGTATMELDFNRLNGIIGVNPKLETLRFDVAADSFFSILVFNELLRGPEQGSMALLPVSEATSASGGPLHLTGSLNQLAIEKLPSGEQFDLAG